MKAISISQLPRAPCGDWEVRPWFRYCLRQRVCRFLFATVPECPAAPAYYVRPGSARDAELRMAGRSRDRPATAADANQRRPGRSIARNVAPLDADRQAA